MEQHNVEFHFAEYVALRSELELNIKSAVQAVLVSLIGNAAVLTWVISLEGNPNNDATRLSLIASFIPVMLTLLAWALFQHRYFGVLRIIAYCKRIEDRFALEGLGWENVGRNEERKAVLGSRHIYSLIFLFQLILSIYLFINSARHSIN